MNISEMTSLLKETQSSMKKSGVHIVTDFGNIVADDQLYEFYVNNLAEGLDNQLSEEFKFLAAGTRESLLHELTNRGGFTPQTIMALPVLRQFWPNLIARELFTLIPMDQPTKMYDFLFPYYMTLDGRKVHVPQNYNSREIFSGGLEIPYGSPLATPVMAETDVLATYGLTPAQAKIQRDFYIVGVEYHDGTAIQTTDRAIMVDDEGNFSFDVRVDPSGPVDDFVTGNVNFVTGVVNVHSRLQGATPGVKNVLWVGSLTGAEENIAPTLKWEHRKVRVEAVDFEVQAEWTIQLEQDYKAIFDLNIQALNIDTLSQTVAQDIDTRLINLLDRTIQMYRTAPEVNKTFSRTPSGGFAYGKRQWYNEIIDPINEVSTAIELETNLGPANIIAGNPNAIHILKMTDMYGYKGDNQGGELGRTPYQGTFNESWKIFASPRIPSNKLYIINKSDNMDKASAIFCPYRVMTISPYPLGRQPNMTFLSRVGYQIIRKECFGVVTVTP
jgi:hypothetical protein